MTAKHKYAIGIICNLGLGLFLTASGFNQATAEVRQFDTKDYLAVSDEHPKAVVLLLPGAFIKASAYENLAKRLVRDSDGDLAVLTAHFFASNPNPLQTESRLDAARDFLRSRGLDDIDSRIYVAGHSAGGIFGSDLPFKHPLGGLILLGSYLPQTLGYSKDLASYPRPVLTLGAELDGLTGLSYEAREFAKAEAISAADPSQRLRKLVIVIPSASHMQFADGSLLKDSGKAEISLEVAHTAIVKSILAFIHSNSPELFPADLEASASYLQAELARTGELLQPFATARAQQNTLCSKLQKQHVLLPDNAWAQINLQDASYQSHAEALAFAWDRAGLLQGPDSQWTLTVPGYLERAPDPFDFSNNHYLSPEVAACKWASTQELETALQVPAIAASLSCAALNAELIHDSLLLLTEGQRNRLFAAYPSLSAAQPYPEGKGFRYGPFEIQSHQAASVGEWYLRPLSLKADKGGWKLQTSEFKSRRLDTGNSSCKLLAPERIIEWATVFALKNRPE